MSTPLGPWSVQDHDAIRRLVSAAFGSPHEAELVDRIRASPEYVAETALIAEAEGEPVGHVIVSGGASAPHSSRRCWPWPTPGANRR